MCIGENWMWFQEDHPAWHRLLDRAWDYDLDLEDEKKHLGTWASQWLAIWNVCRNFIFSAGNWIQDLMYFNVKILTGFCGACLWEAETGRWQIQAYCEQLSDLVRPVSKLKCKERTMDVSQCKGPRFNSQYWKKNSTGKRSSAPYPTRST